MAVENKNLERLLDLAQETSSDRRRELLREITDTFLSNASRISDEANGYFGDIMGKIAYDLERHVRGELARKLAAEEAAPPELVRKLANDEITVAKPILENSPVLSQDDLVDIATRHSQDHLFAITKRHDIGESLSETLVRRGDERVIAGLVTNQNATIGRGAMEQIVTRAQDSEKLHAPVVNRPDLPPDLMQEMFWVVSRKLREKIVEQTSMIDVITLNRMLEEVEEKYERRNAITKRAKSKPEAFIDDLEEQKQLDEFMLVKLARAQQTPELICGFARMTGVDLVTSKRILFDKTGEGLAIACRATDFERNTFSSLLLSVNPVNAHSIEDTYRLLNVYDRLPMDTAQRIMRFWRVRKNAIEAEGDAAA